MTYILRNSFQKLFHSVGTYVMLGIVVVVILAIELTFAFTMNWNKIGDYQSALNLFSPNGGGQILIIPMVSTVIFLAIPIFILIIVTRLFATEIANGEMLLTISKPVTRAEIYWGKVITCLVSVIVVDVFAYLFGTAILTAATNSDVGKALLAANARLLVISLLFSLISVGATSLLSVFVNSKFVLTFIIIANVASLILVSLNQVIFGTITTKEVSFTASAQKNQIVQKVNGASIAPDPSVEMSMQVGTFLSLVNLQLDAKNYFKTATNQDFEATVINGIDKISQSEIAAVTKDPTKIPAKYKDFMTPYVKTTTVNKKSYNATTFFSNCVIGANQGACDLSDYTFNTKTNNSKNDKIVNFFNWNNSIGEALITIYYASVMTGLTVKETYAPSPTGDSSKRTKRYNNDDYTLYTKGWYNIDYLSFTKDQMSKIKSDESSLFIYTALYYPNHFTKLYNYIYQVKDPNVVSHIKSVNDNNSLLQTVAFKENKDHTYSIDKNKKTPRFYNGAAVLVCYFIFAAALFAGGWFIFRRKNFA